MNPNLKPTRKKSYCVPAELLEAVLRTERQNPVLDNRQANPTGTTQTLFDRGYDQSLETIYRNFFMYANCKNFYQFSNLYSAFDAILTSGDSTTGLVTSIPIEYKKRTMSVSEFKSSMFEKPKYESLLEAKNMINAPTAFYIMEFDEVILIYEVKQDPNLSWIYEVHLKDNSSIKEYEYKEVTYLPYTTATYIINKENWQRITVTQLTDYIKEVRLKYYGE